MKKVLLSVLASSALFAGGGVTKVDVPAVDVVPQESHYYVGASLDLQRVNTFKYGPANSYGTTIKAGYEYNKYIALEARYSAGIKRKDNLKMNYYYGLFLKPQYPVYKNFNIYALLGYGKAKVSHNGLPYANNTTIQKDFSYGLGVEYKINNRLSAYAEAVSLIDKKTSKVEGNYAVKVRDFSIGVMFRF